MFMLCHANLVKVYLVPVNLFSLMKRFPFLSQIISLFLAIPAAGEVQVSKTNTIVLYLDIVPEGVPS